MTFNVTNFYRFLKFVPHYEYSDLDRNSHFSSMCINNIVGLCSTGKQPLSLCFMKEHGYTGKHHFKVYPNTISREAEISDFLQKLKYVQI